MTQAHAEYELAQLAQRLTTGVTAANTAPPYSPIALGSGRPLTAVLPASRVAKRLRLSRGRFGMDVKGITSDKWLENNMLQHGLVIITTKGQVG